MMEITKLRQIAACAPGAALNAEDARALLGKLGSLEHEIDRQKTIVGMLERETRRLYADNEQLRDAIDRRII